MKREDIYYQALRSRDHRFDGKFFVGVKTTGIYCRPICPAKPKRQNVEFFQNHIEAERMGYRPCLRCRPESAPQSPAWIGKSAVVRRAVKVLNTQNTIEFSEDRFANLFGVSARHLRRLFIEEIGKTPKQLSFENRLNLARKLLVETHIPISEVAYASGFKSIRRFNDSFKNRFKKNPKSIRRSPISASTDGMKISLPYRPPFHFQALLWSYEAHRVGDLEWFTGEGASRKMHRAISYDGKFGTIAISNDEAASRLIVEINFPDTSVIHNIISRVRALFDLDSDPVVVANSLECEPRTKQLLKKHAGIRSPSGWDPFEVAVSTILGQLISMEQTRSLVRQLIELLGEPANLEVGGRKIKWFPTPKAIASSDLAGLKTTQARKQTLIAFAKAVVDGEVTLETTQDIDLFVKNVTRIRGIGKWTADFMTLKALRHTDSFPSTDLILARTLKIHPLASVQKMSPWRGYAAALYWYEYAGVLKKENSKQGKKK